MDTGDTVTVIPRQLCCSIRRLRCCGVPDGKDTSSLGKAGLLLDTADPLLQDGGDLGGGGLSIGSIASDSSEGGCASLRGGEKLLARGLGREELLAASALQTQFHQ